MSSSTLKTSLKLTCVASILYYFYLKSRSYSFFKRYGYSGPKPKLNHLGNLKQFHDKSNSLNNQKSIYSYSKTLYKWSKKYGKIYGYYQGFAPILVISDVDLVQDVFVNSGKLNQYRRTFPTSKNSEDHDADVFTNNGERWLRVRTQLEKSMLSKSNVAKCIPYFEKSFKTVFLSDNNTYDSRDYDIYVKIKQLMANTMFQLMFGMSLDEHYTKCGLNIIENVKQNDEKNLEKHLINYLVDKFDMAFQEFQSSDPLIKLGAIFFSELGFFWRFCKKLKSRLVYYLQIDSTSGDPMFWFHENFISRQFELYHAGLTSNNFNFFKSFLSITNKQNLTIQEALSNSLLMFFAGYETTANAIAFATFIISTNSIERDRLIVELNQLNIDFNNNTIVGELYDKLEQLKYLDMFIREVLRMYPVANSMVSRKCVQDNFYIGENKEYLVPKGVNVVVDVLSIHYNQKLWGEIDVNRFYPERFIDKHHPCAWLPFGVSRRKCLGMKLAMSQIKLFIVYLLNNYQISSPIKINSNDSNILNLLETKEVLFNVPVNGIKLNIKRNK